VNYWYWNCNCRYRQLELSISQINCRYQQFQLSISAIVIKWRFRLLGNRHLRPIADITNVNYWYRHCNCRYHQLELSILAINCRYQQFQLSISTIGIKWPFCLLGNRHLIPTADITMWIIDFNNSNRRYQQCALVISAISIVNITNAQSQQYQLSISAIRFVDISKSCSLLISLMRIVISIIGIVDIGNHNWWYQQFELSISTIGIKWLFPLP